jgi:6-phosphogluconolactonase (cycloisomerase 2 family)
MVNIPVLGLAADTRASSKPRSAVMFLTLIFILAGCGGSDSSPPQLMSLAVTPAIGSIAVGSTQQFTAIGTYTDHSTRNLTAAVTWSSSSNVVSIGNSSGSQGLATATGAGTASITARLDGVTSPAATLTAAVREFAYTANYYGGNVSEFSVGTGGALTLLGTASTGSGSGSDPNSIAVDPKGRFAYVANMTDGTVSAFSIGSDGALSLIGTVASGNGVTTGNGVPESVTLDPAGQHAYVVNFVGSVSAFSIGADGALTLLGTVALGSGAVQGPRALVIEPTGHYAYVASTDTDVAPGTVAGSVSTLSIGADGMLTLVATLSNGTSDNSIAVDPTGHYLYVGQPEDDTVSAFSIGANGVLALIGTVASQGEPSDVVVDRTGHFVLVTGLAADTVSTYTIGPTGALTLSGVAATGSEPYSVATDPTGHYVYVANSPGSVSEYSIGDGGALSLIGTAATDGDGSFSIIATVWSGGS